MKLPLFVIVAVVLTAIPIDVVLLLALTALFAHGNPMINCASYITNTSLLLTPLSVITTLLILTAIIMINCVIIHRAKDSVHALIIDRNLNLAFNVIDHGIVTTLITINVVLCTIQMNLITI